MGGGKREEGEAFRVAVKIMMGQNEDEEEGGGKRKEIKNIISANWGFSLMVSTYKDYKYLSFALIMSHHGW